MVAYATKKKAKASAQKKQTKKQPAPSPKKKRITKAGGAKTKKTVTKKTKKTTTKATTKQKASSAAKESPAEVASDAKRTDPRCKMPEKEVQLIVNSWREVCAYEDTFVAKVLENLFALRPSLRETTFKDPKTDKQVEHVRLLISSMVRELEYNILVANFKYGILHTEDFLVFAQALVKTIGELSRTGGGDDEPSAADVRNAWTKFLSLVQSTMVMPYQMDCAVRSAQARITPADVARVTAHFQELLTDPDVGRTFYDHFFLMPGAHNDLFRNADIAKTSDKLISMIATALAKLDDVDALMRELTACGERHAKYGVTDEQFLTFRKGFFTTLVVPSASGVAGLEDSWNKVFDLLEACMKRGLQNAKEKLEDQKKI